MPAGEPHRRGPVARRGTWDAGWGARAPHPGSAPDYSVKPTFSRWRLRVGVIADPATFLFMR